MIVFTTTQCTDYNQIRDFIETNKSAQCLELRTLGLWDQWPGLWLVQDSLYVTHCTLWGPVHCGHQDAHQGDNVTNIRSPSSGCRHLPCAMHCIQYFVHKKFKKFWCCHFSDINNFFVHSVVHFNFYNNNPLHYFKILRHLGSRFLSLAIISNYVQLSI